jgi:hypothetical protein
MNINSLLGFLLLSSCLIALPMECESGELAPLIQEYDILFAREITELFTSHITQGFLEKSNKLFSDKKDNDEGVELQPQKKKARRDKSGICPECYEPVRDLFHHTQYRHGEGSKKIPCTEPDCNKYITAKNLPDHMKNIHGPGPKKLLCTHPGCGKQITAKNLQRHIYIAHGQGSQLVLCTHPGCPMLISAHMLNHHLKHTHCLVDYSAGKEIFP